MPDAEAWSGSAFHAKLIIATPPSLPPPLPVSRCLRPAMGWAALAARRSRQAVGPTPHLINFWLRSFPAKFFPRVPWQKLPGRHCSCRRRATPTAATPVATARRPKNPNPSPTTMPPPAPSYADVLALLLGAVGWAAGGGPGDGKIFSPLSRYWQPTYTPPNNSH